MRGISLIEVLASVTIIALLLTFSLYILSLNAKLTARSDTLLRALGVAQTRVEYLLYNSDKLTLASDSTLYQLLYEREVKPGSSSDALYSFYYNYVKGNWIYISPDALKGLRIATRIALYDSSEDLYLVTVFVYEKRLSDSVRLTRVIQSTYKR